MSEDIINDIEDGEYVEFDKTGRLFDYNETRGKPKIASYPAKYKIWNPNPQFPDAARTPGVVMTTREYKGKNEKGEAQYETKTETVESVRAVILFSSFGRELATGNGPTFRTICSSHDGEHPSLRIDQPLCGKATSEDVAKIISGWKGYNEAKINAKVKEVTDGGKLSVCGLKAKSGNIMLCPYARKDPITGARGACKPHIYVRGYDLDRKREFEIRLTGASIDNGQFIAPYHQFFTFLASTGKEVNGRKLGLPCYFFEVKLSALPRKAFFLANFSDYAPIRDKAQRDELKAKAEAAKEWYEKQASMLSKAAYEKVKNEQKSQEKQTPTPVEPALVTSAQVVTSPAVPSVAVESSAVEAVAASDEDPFDTLFEGDDIPW